MVTIPVFGFGLAILCNRIFVLSDIFKRNTLWPGYSYILLILIVGPWDKQIQLIFHGIIGLLILNEIFKLQYNQDGRSNCFNVGLFIGIASILDNTFIILVPFLLLALRNLRPLVFKEYIIYFIGITTPFYFLFAYSFLSEDYSIWNNLLDFNYWFILPESIDIVIWFKWAFALFFYVLILFACFIVFKALPVQKRRIITALFYLTAAINIVAIANGFEGSIIFYLAPIFAFFSTMLMLRYSNLPRIELIHIIFVAAIIGIHLTSKFLFI